MANKNEYPMTQCLLEQGNKQYVAWIPAEMAKLSRVTIKDYEGIWTVKERYTTALSEKVIEHSSDSRKFKEEKGI